MGASRFSHGNLAVLSKLKLRTLNIDDPEIDRAANQIAAALRKLALPAGNLITATIVCRSRSAGKLAEPRTGRGASDQRVLFPMALMKL